MAHPHLTPDAPIREIRLLTERPSQADHIDITIPHSFRHAVGIAPATGSSNNSTRLLPISQQELINGRRNSLPTLSSFPVPIQ